MAALFAAHRVAALVEGLEDVAVADRRLDDMDALALHGQAEAEVGHHGGDDRVFAQGAATMQIGGTDGHDVVAVDDASGVVDGQQAVGVAVERQSEIGAIGHDRCAERVEMRGTAVVVDVATVGSVVDGGDVSGSGGEGAGARALAAPLAQSMTMRRRDRSRPSSDSIRWAT